jgi:hypothetical protein
VRLGYGILRLRSGQALKAVSLSKTDRAFARLVLVSRAVYVAEGEDEFASLGSVN